MPEANDSAWETRQLLPEDVPTLERIAMAIQDAGELAGQTRVDLGHLLEWLPIAPEETIVGLAHGQVIGFAAPVHHQLYVDLGARRKGYGRRLVEAAMALNREHGFPLLSLWLPDGNVAAEAFLRNLDFAYDSSLWMLRLPGDSMVPPSSFPPQVQARSLRRDEDLSRYVGMINRAFIDHPSPLYVTVEAATQAHARPSFDFAATLVLTPADDPSQPIGFCRTRIDEEDGRHLGEVSLIGVLQEWRGQGLGRELLRWGVQRLRRLGVDDLTLNVEADNEAALGLYERAGFRRAQEWPRWSKPTGAPGKERR